MESPGLYVLVSEATSELKERVQDSVVLVYKTTANSKSSVQSSLYAKKMCIIYTLVLFFRWIVDSMLSYTNSKSLCQSVSALL